MSAKDAGTVAFATKVAVIRDALRDYRDVEALLRSPLLASVVVSARTDSDDPAVRLQILRELLTEVLEDLRRSQQDLADVLHRRFWLGMDVHHARTETPALGLADSAFYDRQRRALREFTVLWVDREQDAQDVLNARVALSEEPKAPAELQQPAQRPPAPVPSPEVPPALPEPRRRPRWRLLTRMVIGAATLAAAWQLIRLSPVPTPRTATTVAPTTASAPAPPPSGTPGAGPVCGETARAAAPAADRFVRSQGVSAFTHGNTQDLVRSDKVRALTIDRRGLWVGYFGTPDRPNGAGVGHFDRMTWATCDAPPGDVNAIVSDGTIAWVATEKHGVARFDGSAWRSFRRADGLPSDETFAAAIDPQGRFWAGTWDGLAQYDGGRWTTLTAEDRVLFNSRVHAIAFDGTGGMWVGYVAQGASYHRLAEAIGVHYRVQDGGIGGNELRAILLRPRPEGGDEVWFATADGGVSRFADDRWTVFRAEHGLPSNHARALALDRYKRVWVATDAGVAFFDGTSWTRYTRFDTLAVAIGPSCMGCPIDDDHVWTGTAASGLTHSRLPLPDQVVEVVDIRYPKVVAPGQRFRPQFMVRVRPPYQLRQDRGDFLANTDESDANLFGAWRHIAVKGTVESGQEYTFVDFDTEFTAPQLAPAEQERTFTSTWRVWMFTRYVGPSMTVEFTVRRPG